MAFPKMIKRQEMEGEALFRHYYIRMGTGGSFRKAAAWYAREYGVNPYNGRPYTHEACVQAMWRWGLENLEEAKRIYMMYVIQFETDNSETLDMEEVWKYNVQRRLLSCYKEGTRKYREFYQDHPEYLGD